MKRAKYTEQMPWVGTPTQKEKIIQQSERDRVSQADVVRQAVDQYFDLDDGEIRQTSKESHPEVAF